MHRCPATGVALEQQRLEVWLCWSLWFRWNAPGAQINLFSGDFRGQGHGGFKGPKPSPPNPEIHPESQIPKP